MKKTQHRWKAIRKAAIALSLVSMLCIQPAMAQQRQYKIEAAFLYSFFNYITWPGYESPQALFEPVICVYGKDPILPYLEYVRNRTNVTRTLSVRSVSQPEQTGGCHILFMRHTIPDHIADTLDDSVLTVLKPDDPLDRGGMIELAEEEERILIKINQPKLEQQGFHASSRLLQLAKSIR